MPVKCSEGGRVAVSTYLVPEDHRALTDVAAERDVSVASILRELIRAWLEPDAGAPR